MPRITRYGWSVSVRSAGPGGDGAMTSVGATVRGRDGAVLLTVGGGPAVVLDAAAGALLLADLRAALTAGEHLVDDDGHTPDPAVTAVMVPSAAVYESGEVRVHATRDGRVLLDVVPPGPLAMPLRQASALIDALRSVGREVIRRAADGQDGDR